MADKTDTAKQRRFPVHDIVLVIALAVAVIAAVAGFYLYESNRVPDDAAAKVAGEYLSESDVADYIDQYRTAYNLTDDSDFASALSSQGLNVTRYRENVINQLALEKLIDERAQELNVVPSDDDIQAQVDATKKNYAFNDDDTWNSTLEQYGMTEDDIRQQYRFNLEEQAVLKADVPVPEATDDETLSYAKSSLAGISQKHAYRMVFSGDDAQDRITNAVNELQAAQDAGTLDASSFVQIAAKYSDSDSFSQDGGNVGWSIQVSDDEELSDLLDSLDVGSYSSATDISSDNASEILYCDTSYTFPSSSDISSLQQSDVPESLWDQVKAQAGQSLWSDDCDQYLSDMLKNAKITYYPVPDDASYNVS